MILLRWPRQTKESPLTSSSTLTDTPASTDIFAFLTIADERVVRLKAGGTYTPADPRTPKGAGRLDPIAEDGFALPSRNVNSFAEALGVLHGSLHARALRELQLAGDGGLHLVKGDE